MLTTDADVALLAAEAGARVVRSMFGRDDVARFAKSPSDFATEADLAAEEAIRAVLSAQRPDDGFLGEETGLASQSGGDRRWLVDPLCGTLNFAAHTPLFAVNVALTVGAEVTAAASSDPVAGETFLTDGTAAWMCRAGVEHPLVPSSRSRLVDVDCDGGPGVAGPRLIADPAFRTAFGTRVTSTTLTLAWVAAGRRAGYLSDQQVDGSVHFTAGVGLCQASGCVVTDLTGGPVRGGRGLLAAADEQTHGRLLELLGPALPR
ncbi:MAG: inositol monophosphatase family protein [Jatrophihabitans sp.]|uniref:inositol monophosphatase family protein n=1 Tax=Jatrophihabitans sp. TaxID=1932789 RepID=UPI003F7CDF33